MTRLTLALAVCALVAGCDSDPADSAEFDVLPLSVGESWTFVETGATWFDAEGQPIEQDTPLNTSPRTLSVVRDMVIAGERWARIEVTSEVRIPNYVVPVGGAWFANRESSLFRRLDDGTTERLYSLDAAPGTLVASDALRDVTLVSRDTVLNVPAGPLPTAVFGRTTKAADLPNQDRYPVAPRIAVTQALSGTAGIVVLESLFVGRLTDGELRPVLIKRYGRVED